MIRRLLLVMLLMVSGFCVVATPPLAWAFNLVPFARVAPDDAARAECDADLGPGYYHFSVAHHEWKCHDNWLFLFSGAGIHGV